MTENTEIERAIAILKEIAPAGWASVCAIYRYFDDVADAKVFYKSNGDEVWRPFSLNLFDLMDVFDELRERKFSVLDEPWSVLELRVDLDGAIKVHHDFGDPHILDLTLRISPSL